MKIKKWNYGNYSSDNYGSHTQAFRDSEGHSYYFSYNTLVAVVTRTGEEIIHQNVWGQTTGKHLNWINPDHSIRLSRDEFETAITRLHEYGEVA
jgi:hypothetical protein